MLLFSFYFIIKRANSADDIRLLLIRFAFMYKEENLRITEIPVIILLKVIFPSIVHEKFMNIFRKQNEN